MIKDRSSIEEQFKQFGGFLGLLVPVLQFFFTLIPGSSTNIFLFKEHFLFISIFAALISYILIICAKSYPWFQIPINRKSHVAYQEHLRRQDSRIFSLPEIQNYLKTNPYVARPFYIEVDNIYVVLLISVLISFLTFFGIGLHGLSNGFIHPILIFFQGLLYIFLVSFTTLELAIYNIKDQNSKIWAENERVRVDKILNLVYQNNAFDEFPKVSFIAQSPIDQAFGNQYMFIFKVENRYYKIVTDNTVDKIISIASYASYIDLINNT